jgi:phosphatidate cytidylyltransferase
MSIELKKRIITSFFLLSLFFLMYFYSFILILSLIIIALISWIEFNGLISKIFEKNNLNNRIKKIILKIFSLIYLSTFIFFIMINLELKISIFFIISISILSDLGGLIFGKTFKGKKLTKISPNKTFSGAIGSLLFSLALIPFFYAHLPYLNLNYLIVFTITISVISQFGDLFISFLKRKAKVKNTSDLLPGHGGFLDRVDGIIFAAPIGFILLKLII